MGDIISWLVLGLIAGAVAKLIYPGSQGGGIIVGKVFLGISAGAGALSIALAIVGAIVLIFLWGLFVRRAA